MLPMARTARQFANWGSLALCAVAFIFGGGTLTEPAPLWIIVAASVIAVGVVGVWRGKRMATAAFSISAALMLSLFVAAGLYTVGFVLGRVEVSLFGPKLMQLIIGGTLFVIISPLYWLVQYPAQMMFVLLAVFCLLFHQQISIIFNRKTK